MSFKKWDLNLQNNLLSQDVANFLRTNFFSKFSSSSDGISWSSPNLYNNKPLFEVSKKISVCNYLKSTSLRFWNFINIFCFINLFSFVINSGISSIKGKRKLYISGWLLSLGAGNFQRENLSGQIWPLCSVSVK